MRVNLRHKPRPSVRGKSTVRPLVSEGNSACDTNQLPTKKTNESLRFTQAAFPLLLGLVRWRSRTKVAQIDSTMRGHSGRGFDDRDSE